MGDEGNVPISATLRKVRDSSLARCDINGCVGGAEARIRRDARRLLSGPPIALAEMVVSQHLLLDEALARIAHLEAILQSTDPAPDWPPMGTGPSRRRSPQTGAKP